MIRINLIKNLGGWSILFIEIGWLYIKIGLWEKQPPKK